MSEVFIDDIDGFISDGVGRSCSPWFLILVLYRKTDTASGPGCL